MLECFPFFSIPSLREYDVVFVLAEDLCLLSAFSLVFVDIGLIITYCAINFIAMMYGGGLDWVGSCLFDSNEVVVVNQCSGNCFCISRPRGVYRGVPNGSIIAPLLFFIYLNDLHSSIPVGSFRNQSRSYVNSS